MKIALKNFLTILRRYKVASVLNIVGLSLAFTTFYVIASQVWYSITYNGSLREANRTYVLSPNFGMPSEEPNFSSNSPSMAAHEAAAESPDVEEAASIAPYPSISRIWVMKDEYSYEPYAHFIYQFTPNSPEFFGFEAIAGDMSRIAEPNTVIMSEEMAKKLGLKLGDTIWTDSEGGDQARPTNPYTIVAIFKDMPRNSFLHNWQIIRSDENCYTTTNNNWNYVNLVRLRDGANPDGYARLFQDKYATWFLGLVAEYVEMYPDEAGLFEEGEEQIATRMVRLDKVFYGDFGDPGPFQSGSKSTPLVLSAIALVVVIIAFINFLNFFFALVPVRMRAVNICKVFGASQRSLRWNFLFEAVGLVLIAMVCTLCMVTVVQDSFIADYVICSLAIKDNIAVIGIVAGLMVLLAIITALYPAFYITRFNASLGVKGGFAQSATGRTLRSIMIGVQFTVAMAMLIITSIFFLQYRFMINYDMGFDQSQIVTFASYDLGSKHPNTVIERLMQHPDVEDATASTFNIFSVGQESGQIYDGKLFHIKPNYVLYNFLDFFGFEILAGENFDPGSGQRGEMIIMARQQKEIGTGVGWINNPYIVVGIMKDVRFSSLQFDDDYHTFYCIDAERNIDLGHFYVRLRQGADVKAFAADLRKLAKEIEPAAKEPDLYFLHQWVENMYQQTRKDMMMIGIFALITIVIALMGVSGIVMFEMQHRRQEIAVRKVYGATTRQMVKMLNRRHVTIVLICFAVAAPLGWIFSSRWLESYATRIAQPWWVYVASCLLVMLLTLGIVTLRSYKTASANPSQVLANK